MLDSAVALVISRTFSAVVLLEALRVVGEGVVLRTEEATKS